MPEDVIEKYIFHRIVKEDGSDEQFIHNFLTKLQNIDNLVLTDFPEFRLKKGIQIENNVNLHMLKLIRCDIKILEKISLFARVGCLEICEADYDQSQVDKFKLNANSTINPANSVFRNR